jgi:hypothetical protein
MTLCNVCGQMSVNQGGCLFEPMHRQAEDQDARKIYTANVEAFQAGLKLYDDMVNHPSHYGGGTPHETIECLEAWGLESDALLWNAVKYISRAGKKSSSTMLEDLEKASFYLRRRIAILTGEITAASISRQLGQAAASPSTSTPANPEDKGPSINT